VPLQDRLRNPGQGIEALLSAVYTEPNLFASLRRVLDDNFYATAPGKDPILPSRYEGDDIASAYLKNTPLLLLFEAPIPFGLPAPVRFEHHWIVAGTGHGKSQTLQYLVANDLP